MTDPPKTPSRRSLAPSLLRTALVIGAAAILSVALPFPGQPVWRGDIRRCPPPGAWLLNPSAGHSHAFPERCQGGAIGRLLLAEAIAGLAWGLAGAVGRRRLADLTPLQVLILLRGITTFSALLTVTSLGFALATARNPYSDAAQRFTFFLAGLTALVAVSYWRLVMKLRRAVR